jgi:dihydrofolate reductase
MKIKKGKVIVIEGVDGAGKTTQINFLKEKLDSEKNIFFREPGSTKSGLEIREVILDNVLDAKTELLLFYSARNELILNEIIPALKNGKTVVMGSKTFFSLPKKFRPLPHKKNIVISRNEKLKINDVKIINDISEIEKVCQKNNEIFVIGGSEIYKLFLEKQLVDKIYLTEIDGEFKGDIFFPKIFLKKFSKTSTKFFKKDENNSNNMNFNIYEKK